MNTKTANAFRRLWDLGYTRLVPIVPPGAPISENSSIAKRIAAGDDARGKAPGFMGEDQLWRSFDWLRYETTEADLDRWHAMGAGTGIRLGAGLVLIDADTMNPDHAATIAQTIADMIGQPPVRFGNRPKAGYLLRTDEDFRYARIEFGERNDKGRLLDRVEILAEGRQFVAHGIHPTTLKPYTWPKGIVARDQLPYASGDQLIALLAALRPLLPAASELRREGAPVTANQAALKGDWELVRQAVRATPNTSDLFPTRESYVTFAYAIKAAAGPEHVDEARALFVEWAMRWVDGENEPHIAAADFDRANPAEGFKVGAPFLYETADRHGQGKFNLGSVWFDDTTPEPLFPEEPKQEAPPYALTATPFGFPDPTQIGRRQWLYGRHHIRKFVSATVAPSGLGKSSLGIVEALAMVTGKPLLGLEPHGTFRVWLWNGEDPRDELDRRISAAMMHYQLTPQDIGNRLFVDTGREQEICMARETRDGASIQEPVSAAIVATLLANRIDCLVIDPFVSSHQVSENDNGAIDLVTKRWGKIADICNCAVELVHHVRKLNGGEITVEDSRGAVSMLATARSKRALSRMTPKDAARFGLTERYRSLFRFGDAVNNLAPPAADDTSWMQLVSVPLGNGEGEGIDKLITGDSVGVVAPFDLLTAVESAADGEGASDEAAQALARIREGEWRRDTRAGDAWVGVPVAQGFGLDLDDPEDKGKARSIVSKWIKSGILVEVSRLDAHRKAKTYVEVAAADDDDHQDGAAPDAGLFG